MTSPQTVGGLLTRAAADAPDRRALTVPDGAGSWTFSQLLRDARAVAHGLLSEHQPGDRVATMVPNGADAVLLQLGTALAGMTLVPLNVRTTPDEIDHALRLSGAAVLYTADEADRAGAHTGAPIRALGSWHEVAREGGAELPEVMPRSLAQIQLTSGTTGRPKGVRIRHDASVVTARSFASRLGSPAGSVWVNPMPLFHTAGNVLGTLGALSVLAEQVVLAFEPAAVLRAAAQHRASLLAAAPTLLHMLRTHPDFGGADLTALRVIYTGGSTMTADFLSSVETSFGARVSVAFGMTETCGAALQTAPFDDADETRWSTVGIPLPGTEARVVDPSGVPAPPGSPGELLLRGPGVTDGYHDDTAATAAAFDEDGWLRTGDLATVDGAGRYRIVGRSKELIKSGGENVSPVEVETVLEADPAVERAAVVGLPDDRWGEVVVAFVVPSAGRAGSLRTEALETHCRRHLSRFKVPRRWFVVGELPLTGSGKVRRAELRRLAREDV
ncbi:acyl--CoA ligase [Pseudonocardia sp. DR1-2]|uniref:class I adenylate-forming enzyme family protein n=1 Tax=Pseudonocardia sp. DR1-2 TaxID=2951168 RepID=UPI002043AE91|nr:class I adenylate-forming enzyme family protein [Pseudonocardia sp. DR1-2]MCM3849493.1 acyl--CoA ligase [Pseudonocardia sp. DR1-2]